MKTALIITLGTRDIQLTREFGEKLKTHAVEKGLMGRLYHEGKVLLARPAGEFLLSKYDKELQIDRPPQYRQPYKAHITFPIVKPALDHVLEEDEHVDQLIFVSTDQDAQAAGEFFYNRDTVHFGNLLMKLVQEQYPGKIAAVANETVKDNVSYLDSMFAYWSKELDGKPFRSLQKYDRIYLCNQGGIDAINTALMLNCLNKFGNKLYLLSVDEKNGICTSLQFVQQYLRENERNKAEALLQRYDYPALGVLNIPQMAKYLAAYAAHRLNFDFEACIKVVTRMYNAPDTRNLMQQMITQFRQMQQDEKALLKELYINAKIKYHQEAYVDFLLRMFRIIEETARQKAISYLPDFVFNAATDHWPSKFVAYAEKTGRKNLIDTPYAVPELKIANVNMDKMAKPTIPVWLKIIALQEGEEQTYTSFIRSVLPLTSLRNNSIGAHSFDPVSQTLITQALAETGKSIEQVFTFLDQALGVTENPYDAVNKQIRALL